MAAATKISLETLPTPQKTRGGQGKLIALTILAVALVAGAAFWFTRDEESKERLKTQVQTEAQNLQSSLQTAAQGTPFEGVTHALTGALSGAANVVSRMISPPPPPPVGLSKPATEPGTLSGQVVVGTLPSGVDPAVDPLNPLAPLNPDAPESGAPEVLPKVEEDSVVRVLFIQDLAQWMVSRYQPGKGGGSVSLGLQAANLRYGASLRGIATKGEDVLSGREKLFRYAFTPTMLRALYGLYVDRFVDELGRAAAAPTKGKALSPQESDDMYRAYGQRCQGLAVLLDNIAHMPDFREAMDKVDKSAQAAIEVHSQIGEAVFALDELREKGSPAQIQTAQLRLDGLHARYRRAIDERSAAQQAFVNSVRGSNGRGMDEETTLFVSNWIGRRLDKQAEAQHTAGVAAQILYDLSRRLQQAASVAR